MIDVLRGHAPAVAWSKQLGAQQVFFRVMLRWN
jgi:hypothetical protein